MSEKFDAAPYRALWSAVLFQAIRDADAEIVRGRKGPGFYWIFHDRTSVGSMRWICDMLDFDYHKLQMMCTTRAGRAKILNRKQKEETYEAV